MKSIRYYCHVLIKIKFSLQVFEKSSNIKIPKLSSVWSSIVPHGQKKRQTDEHTYMKNLIAAVANLRKSRE